MNSDVEDLLREGMERFTMDLRAPAGMMRRAEWRRHRRIVLRSGSGLAAAAALAAAAVVLVTVVVPDSASGSGVLAAYVLKRVDSALTTAEPGDIAQMTVVTTGSGGPGFGGSGGASRVTTTTEEWSHDHQWRSVTYSASGQPEYDEGFSAASVYTLVSYPAREWASEHGLGSPLGLLFGPPRVGLRFVPPSRPVSVPVPGGCHPVLVVVPSLFQPGLPGIGFSASSPPMTLARALRTAVSCGTLVETGRQRVNGVEAIKLTSRAGIETVWVSPGTYLPVRVVLRSVPGAGGPASRLTANITWLKPTARNLAELTVPIPAGFSHVSLANALGRTLLRLGPGLKLNGLCAWASVSPRCQGPAGFSGFGPALSP
jgi:hypothetical protein